MLGTQPPTTAPRPRPRRRASRSLAERAGSGELASTSSSPLSAARRWLFARLDNNERTLRRLTATVVTPTNACEPRLRALSDAELAAETLRLRARLAAGVALDALVPEAFAAVREAARRQLGLRHYDVQLVGGAVLHEGGVAEMRTGEGKTLVATLAAYVNALPGGGVHVVTVNDYLARRDSAWMGRIFTALGMTCGCVTSDILSETRKTTAGYGADVVYVTNSELGFDYLRDNMAQSAEELLLARPFAYALVDEVDSVLIDEGRSPLLISTMNDIADSWRYSRARDVAASLREGWHYEVDRKSKHATLTEEGMLAAEAMLEVSDCWDGAEPWAKFVLNAVKAKELFLRDVQYIVRDGAVQIVDEFTGRVSASRRWTDNIHQAVEAKEGLRVAGEAQTAATITYQSFFRLYPKLAGMTGTARTEDEVFWRTYRMDVVTVPTHAPCIRQDSLALLYVSAAAKWAAVADAVAEAHSAGIPVLVGTASVENSELLAGLLDRYSYQDSAGRWLRGVPHNLLNARAQYAAQEAAIVAQAGRSGAVTIATNMAGRGTDIVLGGSPTGLARTALADALWPAMGLGPAPVLLAGGAPPPLHPATRVSLDAAVALAAARWGDAAEPPSAAEVQALVDDCMDKAEHGASTGELNVGMRGLVAAATLVLADCRRACAEDGARVRQLGGLRVLGTQVHESRRIDNQLRGRAGRQGDPGSTQFFISLQDELMVTHCPEWAARPLWELAGASESEGLASALVEREVTAIQQRVERFFAAVGRDVASYDEVLATHRNATYSLRRALLLEDSQQLRARWMRYLEALVSEAADAAGVHASTPPQRWDMSALLADCRDLTAGISGRQDALLAGVDARSLAAAVVAGEPLPLPRRLPPVNAHPGALAAALAGIPWQDGDASDGVQERAAAAQLADVGARVAERVRLQGTLRGGRWALQAALLRAYFMEHAVALYDDRCARLLARGVHPEDLRMAERAWLLRALDDYWQRHIAAMAALRNSVNLRAFGLLEPLEEYNIDGARAFAELVVAVRRRAVQSLFACVDEATFKDVGVEEATDTETVPR